MRLDGPGWAVEVGPAGVDFIFESRRVTLAFERVLDLPVRRRWWRWGLQVESEPRVPLPRLRRRAVKKLREAVAQRAVEHFAAEGTAWTANVEETLARYAADQRWIPRELVEDLLERRPLRDARSQLEAAGLWGRFDPAAVRALERLDSDLMAEIEASNEETVRRELETRAEFFATVERTPLTEEQARAVVCFDNRVQLVAAAGSGKTSVMVARAAYAVARGFVQPDRILLLAYNREAARELQARVEERFRTVGIDSSGVRAQTLHAFGYGIIGEAQGERPPVASWLAVSPEWGARKKIREIVEDLSSSSPEFAMAWALYGSVFGKSRSAAGSAKDEGSAMTPPFPTYKGEPVRSEGEQLIANWLYLHHVDYEYERSFAVKTASSLHAQYRPDFYYPAIDSWHEHWAVGRDGRPPASFKGYKRDMEWKQKLHAKHGTHLIETTAFQIEDEGPAALERALRERGADLVFDPNRQKHGDRPLTDGEVVEQLVRFMTHVKARRLTREMVDRELERRAEDIGRHRSQVFLTVFWAVLDRWQADLAAEGSLDFEDMVHLAADHLEAGHQTRPYDLILVDELQDSSRSRARLIQALLERRGTFLLGVGDDWQSIYGFNGADVSVMTDFTDFFGPGPRLALTNTFRCSQTICDVASSFIMKNPRQLKKLMVSAVDTAGPRIEVVGAPEADTAGSSRERTQQRLRRAVDTALRRLSADVASGQLASARGGPITVDVLGRYRHDKDLLPQRSPSNLRVTFRTVHAAKGLEADCVILPSAISGKYGFPNLIEDDPILTLAMPGTDEYLNAEERRLMYVALTRARQRVIIVTVDTDASPFVLEVIADGEPAGRVTKRDLPDKFGSTCPECKSGQLTVVVGQYRERSLVCHNSGRERCRYREALETKQPRRPATRGGTAARSLVGKSCPECRSGTIRIVPARPGKYSAFVGCSRFRQGCRFKRWLD